MSSSATTRADRVLFGLFALFLFGSTFSIALAQSSLGLALAVFLVITIRRRENPFGGQLRPLYIVIGLYMLWVIVSSLLGPTPGESVVMEREDWLFFIIPITVYLLQNEKYRRWLPRVLAAGVIVMAAYGIVQHFTGFSWPDEGTPPRALGGGYFAEGTFTHHLTYGNYFAMASCFALAYGVLASRQRLWSWRGVIIAAALVGLAATVFSYARMALAALPVTLLFLAALKGRRYFVAAVAVVLLGGVGAFLWVPGVAGSYRAALDKDLAGENQASRIFIWKKSLAIVGEHPVTGVGLGNFWKAYQEQNDPERGENRVWPHAHNDVISVAAVAGIPGAVFFVAIWVIVFVYFGKGWRKLRGYPGERALVGAAMTGSVIFALCSITEAAFADEETRQLLMFVWGTGLAWVRYSEKLHSIDAVDGSIEQYAESR